MYLIQFNIRFISVISKWIFFKFSKNMHLLEVCDFDRIPLIYTLLFLIVILVFLWNVWLSFPTIPDLFCIGFSSVFNIDICFVLRTGSFFCLYCLLFLSYLNLQVQKRHPVVCFYILLLLTIANSSISFTWRCQLIYCMFVILYYIYSIIISILRA